jgi:hypothetical protein
MQGDVRDTCTTRGGEMPCNHRDLYTTRARHTGDHGRRRGRPSKSWGSGRQGLFLQLQIRIPALEHRCELLIQGFHPRLQQQMGTPLGPLHLLAFTLDFGHFPRHQRAGKWQLSEGLMAGAWEAESFRDVYLLTRLHRISRPRLPALAWPATGRFLNGQSRVTMTAREWRVPTWRAFASGWTSAARSPTSSS